MDEYSITELSEILNSCKTKEDIIQFEIIYKEQIADPECKFTDFRITIIDGLLKRAKETLK